MTSPNTQSLPSEDQAAEKATADYLKGHYKGMSDDMAGLWARAIAIEERDKARSDSNPEMTPDLAAHVEDARMKARAALEPDRPKRLSELLEGKSPEEQQRIREEATKNSIIRSLVATLRRNDSFHAYYFMEEAIEAGINVSDVVKDVKTELDPAGMEKELRGEMEKKNPDGTIVIDDLPFAVGGA